MAFDGMNYQDILEMLKDETDRLRDILYKYRAKTKNQEVRIRRLEQEGTGLRPWSVQRIKCLDSDCTHNELVKPRGGPVERRCTQPNVEFKPTFAGTGRQWTCSKFLNKHTQFRGEKNDCCKD